MKMKEDMSCLKSSSGPSSATRSKSFAELPGKDSETHSSVTRRIEIGTPTKQSDNKLDTVTLCNALKNIDLRGRCDDGADDSLVSKDVAEKGLAMGIGHMSIIPCIEVQMPILGKIENP